MSRLHKVTLISLDKMQYSRKWRITRDQSKDTQTKHVAHTTRIVNLSRIVNNTLISLLGQVVTWSSTFLLTIAYGRFLGDVKFGELYFALTFVLLIGFPIEFGFNQQLTRDVAQEPSRVLRYLSNILVIKVVLWLILYGVILLICWLLGYPEEVRILVAICGVTLLSNAIGNVFGSSHYAFERAVFPVVGSILEKGLTALFGFVLLRYGASVQIMAFVLLSGSLVNTMWQAIWFFRLTETRFSVDFSLIRNLLYTSVPFIIYGVLGVIYYRLDTILLSLLTNTAVVGWYGAGYRIFDTFVFLPSIVINAIMYPVFSRLSLYSTSTLKIAMEKTLNFLLFFGLPIATVMIVGAPSIIGLLYHNSEFINSIPALQALAPGLVLLYINTVLGSVLISMKREKKITIMAAVALVFNLGLNIILIPRYQHVGAAIVTSLTELLLLGLTLIFFPRPLLPLRSIYVGGKILIASLVMALSVWSLSTFTVFVALPVGICVYVGVAILLGTIPREDMQAVYSTIRNKIRTGPSAASAEKKRTDLQTTLELAAIRSTSFPVLPAYQTFIEMETTLELAAVENRSLHRRKQAADFQRTKEDC